MIKLAARISLALTLAAGPAAAQYTRPGELGEFRLTTKERILRASQTARWQLGPFELEPRLAISELGYVSNIYFSSEGEALSDLRAKGSAGLRGFFNLGPKVTVSPFADLTYAWWDEQTELRSWSESLGLQILGDFNRLQLQLQAGSVEAQRELSSEVQVPIDRREDRLEVDFDVDFRGPFRLFGKLGDLRVRYRGTAAEERVPGLDLGSLEADGKLLRGGVAYELGSGLQIGLGIERAETDYLRDPGRRSNSGSGPLLTVGYDGARLRLELVAAHRDIEFDGRESGRDRSQTIGRSQLRFQLGSTLTATLYGDIDLSAAALDQQAIFETRRTGISLQRDPGERARIGVFFEIGEDEFASVAGDRVSRLDEFRSYGVDLHFQLTRQLNVELGYLDTRRTSSLPGFDREYRAFTSNVSLGGDLLSW